MIIKLFSVFNLATPIQPQPVGAPSDGGPEGALPLGSVAQVRGQALITLHGCCDFNQSSPGVTLYSAMEGDPRTRPSLALVKHRSYVGPELLYGGPLVSGSIIGVQSGILAVEDCVFPVHPRAITSVGETFVTVKGTLFFSALPDDAPVSSSVGHQGILHRYGGAAIPNFTAMQSLLRVTDCMFVRCFAGVEVRARTGTVQASTGNVVSSLVCQVLRNMFVGYDEALPDEAPDGQPQVRLHLIAVAWQLRETARWSALLQMENNIVRAYSEALGVTGWWWSNIRFTNNTVLYPRFAAVNFDSPNTPAQGPDGLDAARRKNVHIVNNLFQGADFPAFSNAGSPFEFVFEKTGVMFLGADATQWAQPGSAFGALAIATNYLANFADFDRLTWWLDANSTLNGTYSVAPPSPLNNPDPGPGLPADSALLRPPFAFPNPDYRPRLLLSPPVSNASDASFFMPPTEDFYDSTRVNAADLGAVENITTEILKA